jgi:hypothetical protein
VWVRIMFTSKMPSLPSCSKRNDEEAERDGKCVKKSLGIEQVSECYRTSPLLFNDLQELTLWNLTPGLR